MFTHALAVPLPEKKHIQILNCSTATTLSTLKLSAAPKCASVIPNSCKLIANLKIDKNIKCLACTSTHCISGSESGRVHIWSLSTGALECFIDAHFSSVSCITVTPDLKTLITSSKDGSVNCYKWTDILLNVDGINPFATYSHPLAVTRIVCGIGMFYTCSKDKTCRIYSLKNGLLCTIVYPRILSSIAVDACQDFIYASDIGGNIHAVDLNVAMQQQVYQVESTALFTPFHVGEINQIDLTTDCCNLVSSGVDGCVVLWDIQSRQAVKTLCKQPTSVDFFCLFLAPQNGSFGLFDTSTFKRFPEKSKLVAPPVHGIEYPDVFEMMNGNVETRMDIEAIKQERDRAIALQDQLYKATVDAFMSVRR